MKVRRRDLRNQYCSRPETRKPQGRTLRSFTPNDALPPQTISPHAAGALACSHAGFPHDSHRAGRSRRADAREGAAPGQLTQLRHLLGLDLPLHTQYGHYLWQLARGDLGQSSKFQAPERQIIFGRYPATLQLAFLALVVALRSVFLPECLPPIAAVNA